MNSRFVKEQKAPGFIGSGKAPAIRGQGSSSHRGHQGGYVRNNKRRRPRSSKPRKRSVDGQANNMYNMSLYIGVESFYGKPQDS
jgi:hypothetical protein